MPRNSKADKKQRNTTPRRSAAAGRVRRGRPKICVFCAQRSAWVDYKDVNLLRRFMSDRGKIKSRGSTGNCAQHQRDVAIAIKNARELALLPYAVRTVASDTNDRRGRTPRPAARPGAESGSSDEAKTDSESEPGEPDSDDAGDTAAATSSPPVEASVGSAAS